MIERLEQEFISYDRQRFESTVDTTRPTTGVINLNAFPEWLFEELTNAINLDYESAIDEGLTDEELEYADFSESDLLVGGWTKDSDGLYSPDESADWSGIYRGDKFTLQVVWSKTVKRFNSPTCQPCYPGQVDIESGESESGYLAFCLPDYEES